MDYLVDSSVLIRFVAKTDPLHERIIAAIGALIGGGHSLYFTPQTARETWSVLTRPAEVNGYGLSPTAADFLLTAIGRAFVFLDDVPGVYYRWRLLVTTYGVSGKQIHDANHVAAMFAHGVTNILTLDSRDFSRYPEIQVAFPT